MDDVTMSSGIGDAPSLKIDEGEDDFNAKRELDLYS